MILSCVAIVWDLHARSPCTGPRRQMHQNSKTPSETAKLRKSAILLHLEKQPSSLSRRTSRPTVALVLGLLLPHIRAINPHNNPQLPCLSARAHGMHPRSLYPRSMEMSPPSFHFSQNPKEEQQIKTKVTRAADTLHVQGRPQGGLRPSRGHQLCPIEKVVALPYHYPLHSIKRESFYQAEEHQHACYSFYN